LDASADSDDLWGGGSLLPWRKAVDRSRPTFHHIVGVCDLVLPPLDSDCHYELVVTARHVPQLICTASSRFIPYFMLAIRKSAHYSATIP